MNNFMDRTELAISLVSDINLIKYFFTPEGTAGLLIIYKGTEHISLLSDEKYFELLEDKAAEGYLSAPFSPADDFTRDILKGRTEDNIPPSLSGFIGQEGSDVRKGHFEKNTLLGLSEMLEYCLGALYTRLGGKTDFPLEITGYRSRYCIKFGLNGEKKALPMTFRESSTEYEFTIGGFFRDTDCLRLAINFFPDRISLRGDLRCKKYILAEAVSDLCEKTHTVVIAENGETVYSRTIPLKEASPSEKAKELAEKVCGIDAADRRIFALPFGTLLARENESVKEYITVTGSTERGCALIRHSSRSFLPGSGLPSDSFYAVHEVCRKGDLCVLTGFLPTGTFSKGYYKRELSGRYFTRTFD